MAGVPESDPRLLVVILRGGVDGLSTVVPIGDPNYVSMRGHMAVRASSTQRLDGFFGLHPALTSFSRMYRAGEAAVVHATCVPLHNRSHFDAQDNLENGMPGRASNATGWLNRLLTVLPPSAPIKNKGAIEIGHSPVILRGPAPVLGWSPTWFAHVDRPLRDKIRSIYGAEDRQMLDNLDRGLQADELAERLGAGGDGSISVLRKGFRGAGRLLAATDGPRIAALSVDGWDTHTDQGCETGTLAACLAELDLGLSDFQNAVGATWSNTVVLLVTEFGRTVQANGGGGTEHGVGTVALMAGGAVNGGKVFSDWPGLNPRQLYKESLRPTTDIRSVFKGVLLDHLQVPPNLLNSAIFPGSRLTAPPMRNLIRTSPTATASMSAGTSRVATRSEPAIALFREEQRASLSKTGS
jgi:uncharacterized protein (DUF1501 family)